MSEFATGLVRHPEKHQIMQRSHAEHADRLESQQNVALPPAWDSREQGWVGPVQNQGNCASCWCFSGTGIIEIAYLKSGFFEDPNEFVLSKQYLISCLGFNGCKGGDNVTALMQAQYEGIPTRAEYGDYGPYDYPKSGDSSSTALASPTYKCRLQPEMLKYKITSWGLVDGEPATLETVNSILKDTSANHDFAKYVPTVSKIKSAIMHYGAVGAGIAGATEEKFTSFAGKNKVFECTGATAVDHDIILVGWDDSKGSRGAWLLKNSWGTDWGDGGYCWVAYGANNVGYEAVWCELEVD